MDYVESLFNTNFLFEMDDGKFHKVANVVGYCMKYHPHGDASIGNTLVVLANKSLFIDKQGSFGNIYTGDEASAPRYIECRITSFAKEILYNPHITRYVPSYDGRNKEPAAFRAKLPVLLTGAEGITVGMSTKILLHITELIRKISESYIDTLLKIPIRRIPRYDREKKHVGAAEITSRLKEIARLLKNLKKYALSVLDGITAKLDAGTTQRKTAISSFMKVAAKQAVARDTPLCYDDASGCPYIKRCRIERYY